VLAFGHVQPVQRGRHVALADVQEGDVVVDEGELEIELAEPAHPFRLGQLGRGGGELGPVDEEHPAVGVQALHPGPVGVPAQHRQCRAVVGECVVQRAELLPDGTALHGRAGPLDAGEVGQRRLDRPQRAAGVAVPGQGEGQAHPGLAEQPPGPGAAGTVHRRPQQPYGGVETRHVHGGEPGRAFGHRGRRVVVRAVRAFRQPRGLPGRLPRVDVHERQHPAGVRRDRVIVHVSSTLIIGRSGWRTACWLYHSRLSVLCLSDGGPNRVRSTRSAR
jgi:hypothetical protein